MPVAGLVRRAIVGLLAGALFAGPAGAARPHSAHQSNSQQHHATARHATASGSAHLHKRARASAKPATKIARHGPTPRHRNAQAAHPAPKARSDRPLIVIDPGHGGNDPGAIGVSGTPEKTITLATALELRHVLQASGRYRVALTRSGDHPVSLSQRLSFARTHDADLLIAIHADASRDPRARGASVYIRSGEETLHLGADRADAGRIASALSGGAPQAEEGSAWLQYTMVEQLADDVRMAAAPARAAHFYVLSAHSIPSVLLEMGFMSNRKDEAQLRQTEHRRVIVEAIKDAIDDYFRSIKAGDQRL
jgi:N-acetylmuramoyl-L-alanine amidase